MEDNEIKVCSICGFELGTDDCTCNPWMDESKFRDGETRMDFLVGKKD